MANIYDQIDTRLNILYDFMYNKKSDNCYVFNGISRKNIKLEDLKMPDDFDSTDIFNEKSKFLGFYNNRWNFKRYSSTSFPSMMIVGRYNEGKKHNSLSRGELYDIGMMYIISEICANEKFYHSLIPVMCFDIKLENLKNANPSMYKDIKNNNEDMKDHDMFYVIVAENYYTTMTLNEYLTENYSSFTEETWRVLMFQVVFALSKLYSRLNGFRHNKLDLDSVLVVLKNDKAEKVNYTFGDKAFVLPNVGFDIKVSNYFHSITTDYENNADATGREDNPYYDIYYFLTSLQLRLKTLKYNLPKSVKNFIKTVIPESMAFTGAKFAGLDEDMFNNSDTTGLPVPGSLLKKNPYFDSFLHKRMDLTVSPVEAQKVSIEMLNGGGKKKIHYDSDYEGYDQESITEIPNDRYRLLGRVSSTERKNSRVNNIKVMPRSTRKMKMPIYSEYSENGDSDKYSKSDSSQYEDEVAHLRKAVDSQAATEDSDGSDLSDLEETAAMMGNRAQRAMVALSGNSHNNKKGKKHRKGRRSHRDSESQSEAGVTNGMSNALKSQLENVPENYFDEAPSHLRDQFLASQGNDMNADEMPYDSGMAEFLGMSGLTPGMNQMGPGMGSMGSMGSMGPGMGSFGAAGPSGMNIQPPSMNAGPGDLGALMNPGMGAAMPELGMPGLAGMAPRAGAPGLGGLNGMPGMPGMPGMMGGNKSKYFLSDGKSDDKKKDFFF